MKDTKKKLSPIESRAKMDVLEKLKQDMQDMMGDKMAGLKKVTVAAPDAESLKQGLEHAQDLVGATGEHDGNSDNDDDLDDDNDEDAQSSNDDHSQEEGSEHESEEQSPEEDASEHEDGNDHDDGETEMSDEDIDKLIEELMRLKEAKSKGM